MDQDTDSPTEQGKNSEKIFYIHSRNSSVSSLVGEGEEDSAVLLRTEKKSLPFSEVRDSAEEGKRRCKISASGRCMCKVSVIVYLATCITVSALYVVYFAKNQAYFGDAWIPGKPTHNHRPDPVVQEFQDLPYTEWISQRWTYFQAPFADWPFLPSQVDKIQQLVEGEVMGKGGLWLLTPSQLYFVRSLNGGLPESVDFVNIGGYLDLEIMSTSYLAPTLSSSFFFISPGNITYVDCSKDCEVMGYYEEAAPFDSATSSTYSLSDGTLWLGTNVGLYNLSWSAEDGVSLSNFSVIGTQQIHSLAWRSLVSGAPDSRHKNRQFSFLLQPGTENRLQETFACSSGSSVRWTGSYWGRTQEFGLLVVGTVDRLHFFDGHNWWYEWVSLWSNGTGGVIDGTAVDMTFGPSGELYIANNVSLSRLNINYTFDRIGPLQGLPYNQLTSLYVSPYAAKDPPPFGPVPPTSEVGTLWVGTGKGYALYDIQRSGFISYHNGPRWLPGGTVEGLVGSGRAVVAVTDGGLAVVHPEEWTLEKKAGHYQAMLARHTRPPGLVANCLLSNFTPSTCAPGPTDNDGLWTSWMVAAEAFRYQVTKDPAAKTNAWELFQGMKFLVNVTDVPGYMARSVVHNNSSMDGKSWHESVSEPGWMWKGDTSSDEVVGHMWAYPLIHDLLDEEEEGAMEAVRQLISTIMEVIKDHGYVLTGEGNHTTSWGVWSPAQLNLNRSWSDERGLNSLQLLSYLLSAYRLTENTQFLTAFNDMLSGSYEGVATNYGMNIINQKIMFPRDDNFSDDELAFLPYFLYFYTLKNVVKHELEELAMTAVHVANLSLEHSWSEVRRTKSAPWTVIYTYSRNKLCDPSCSTRAVGVDSENMASGAGRVVHY